MLNEALKIFEQKSNESGDKLFVNHETPRQISAYSWRCLNEYAEKMENGVGMGRILDKAISMASIQPLSHAGRAGAGLGNDSIPPVKLGK